MERVALGEYLPDLPPILNPGLTVAKDAVPIAGGWNPTSQLAQVAGFTALAERPRGAIATIDRAGNPLNFAGTATKLYRLKTLTEDWSRSTGGAYNCAGDLRWEFAIFRNFVIAVNPADETQYYDIDDTTKPFRRLGNATTIAPRAKTIGVIGQFVMLGNTFDTTNGQDETAVHWCALNDPLNWPSGEAAVALLSGRQPLSGNGGAVQRVVGGAEVGCIFQERSIHRADFVGGAAAFQFTRVEPHRGLLIPDLAVPFGRHVFYLSEDGFYTFDYTTSKPIGRERIDRTFLSDVDSSYFDRVSAVADPDTQRIWVLYPGSGHTAGRPNRWICYDWGLDRFGHGELDAELLTLAVQAGVDIDTAGSVGDPNTTSDDPAYPDGGIDGPGLPSFDVRVAAPGSIRLGAYDTSFRLSDFAGASKGAVFETGRREHAPGRRSLVSDVRTLVDDVFPQVQVASIGRTNDAPVFGPPEAVDEDGVANVRSEGRYHAYRVTCPPGFSNALALDVGFRPGGTR